MCIVIVPLTQGKHAVIDVANWDKIRPYKWHVLKQKSKWYAATKSWSDGRILMHHLILPPVERKLIDHKDGNGCNNLVENLRHATNAENIRNRMLGTNNTSGYKGVNLDKRRGKWRATIKKDYKEIWIGYFHTPQAAALAYNEKATELFGEFARLNEVNN